MATNQVHVANYVSELSQELAELARNAQLSRLVRILDDATLEARNCAAEADTAVTQAAKPRAVLNKKIPVRHS